MTQETHPTSRRFTLVEKEDYKVDLEYGGEFGIIHLPYVHKFSKGMYIDMMYTLEDIQKFLFDMGFDNLWVAVEPQHRSTAKLAKRFGFEFKGSSDGFDVYLLEGIE